MPDTTFDPVSYWRGRLSACPSLQGTGSCFAPLCWQKWLYRGKTRAYLRLMDRAGFSVEGRDVLDFGCGTGYFEDLWESLGAGSTGGVDVSEEMIERNRARHPGRTYICADLARDADVLRGLGEVDFVTAIDVLFHIVDERALRASLEALLSALRTGGYFMFTDALRSRPTAEHVRFRSYGFWQELLPELGLEYVAREPVFVANNRLFRGFRWVSRIAGPVAHFADSILLRAVPNRASNWAVLARRSREVEGQR
ncbi:MAG: class I SAM-dependent methyltransferase [Planctomycetota bacterium]